MAEDGWEMIVKPEPVRVTAADEYFPGDAAHGVMIDRPACPFMCNMPSKYARAVFRNLVVEEYGKIEPGVTPVERRSHCDKAKLWLEILRKACARYSTTFHATPGPLTSCSGGCKQTKILYKVEEHGVSVNVYLSVSITGSAGDFPLLEARETSSFKYIPERLDLARSCVISVTS